MLRDSDGSVVWDHDGKQQIMQSFFENLLGKKVTRTRNLNWPQIQPKTLQQIPGLELDREFTEGEIEQAVQSLPNEKAPGPDGFTNDFYKSCWPIIKHDVLSAF